MAILKVGEKTSKATEVTENLIGMYAQDDDGNIGIITYPTRHLIYRARGGFNGLAYTGIDLRTGQQWFSPNPKMIGRFTDLLSSKKTFNEWVKDNANR